MIIRLLSYATLALAVLNGAEMVGLVEKGKYVPWAPRWESPTNPAVVSLIDAAHSGLTHIRTASQTIVLPGNLTDHFSVNPASFSTEIDSYRPTI